MEANGRLQGSNNKRLWPECLVEAAAGGANGRLEHANKRGPWTMEANGRLQGSKTKRLWPECLAEAAAGHFRGCKGGQTAGLNAHNKRELWTKHANGRLQGSKNKCLWPECLVEAAAGHFRGCKGGANGRLVEHPNKRELWTKDANGRLEGSKNKCLWPECLVEATAGDFKGCKAGKRHAWTPEQETAMAENREALRHLKPTKRSSTPAVAPGAAPALAKAGVGGYTCWRGRVTGDGWRDVLVFESKVEGSIDTLTDRDASLAAEWRCRSAPRTADPAFGDELGLQSYSYLVSSSFNTKPCIPIHAVLEAHTTACASCTSDALRGWDESISAFVLSAHTTFGTVQLSSSVKSAYPDNSSWFTWDAVKKMISGTKCPNFWRLTLTPAVWQPRFVGWGKDYPGLVDRNKTETQSHSIKFS